MGGGTIWGGQILWRKEDSTRFDTQHRRSKKKAPVPVRKPLENTSSGFTTAIITTGWLMEMGWGGGERGILDMS